MFHSFSLFLTLYAFWLLLSGFFTPFLMAAGAGSALAVVWFARRMDVVDHEGHPIQLGARALVYWIWLFKEITKSAWDVSKIILNPKLPISPTMVRFKPSQRTDVGLVLHASAGAVRDDFLHRVRAAHVAHPARPPEARGPAPIARPGQVRVARAMRTA